MATSNAALHFDTLLSKHIRVRGLVQGVGFRPSVWRLAQQFNLSGHVLNDGEGVLIEVSGTANNINLFTQALEDNPPPLARIDSLESHELEPSEAPENNDFNIIKSHHSHAQTGVGADAATCPECLQDTLDPNNRRFRYPFTNCTHCGPRLSIIKAIPYDRQYTSMAKFKLCDSCQSEYQNPADRRFHAQPNACPECGPKAWLEQNDALKINAPSINSVDDCDAAAQRLKQGYIVAIKGIGGFHLACDATNNKAVALLRQRKHRYAKPFALMAANTDIIKQYCQLNEPEESLLNSPQAPIVLLQKKSSTCLAQDVAAKQNTLGFMLPYTPLHHILLSAIDVPIVMTSGNLSDSPQVISNDQAREQLSDIADFFLLHNRDIVNRMDDSVLRVVDNKTQILRRARGYAPIQMQLPAGFEQAPNALAYGGELKNTFCLTQGSQAILSQHMGDLENARVYDDYCKHLEHYQTLHQHTAALLAIDHHPEYLSSKLGRAQADEHDIKLTSVQHHHAHIAACLAENHWPRQGEKVLGIAFDGLGFGTDDTLWGAEFLLADYVSYQRLAHLQTTPMLGSQQAIYQPWRNTYAHLSQAFDWDKLTQKHPNLELLNYLQNKPLKTLDAMLAKQINAPLASSSGRLFDAVAAAVGICQEQVQYEGQAAIELEALVTDELIEQEHTNAYCLTLNQQSNTIVIETKSLWQSVLNDLASKTTQAIIATRFHLGLSQTIVKVVNNIKQNNKAFSSQTVALSGGVFQNKILHQQVTKQLKALHYTVLTHSLVPANDGGLALGQAMVAIAQHLHNEEKRSCV